MSWFIHQEVEAKKQLISSADADFGKNRNKTGQR